MARLVALLRGINVGRQKRIAMADLRRLAGDLGYTEVSTLLNSGNLVLTSDDEPTVVEGALSSAIGSATGHQVDVHVRTAAEFAAVLDEVPWPDDDPARVTTAFLRDPADAGLADRLAGVAAEDEPFQVAGRQVYVRYGRGQAASALAARFDALVGQSCTVRNLNTLRKIQQLLQR